MKWGPREMAQSSAALHCVRVQGPKANLPPPPLEDASYGMGQLSAFHRVHNGSLVPGKCSGTNGREFIVASFQRQCRRHRGQFRVTENNTAGKLYRWQVKSLAINDLKITSASKVLEQAQLPQNLPIPGPRPVLATASVQLPQAALPARATTTPWTKIWLVPSSSPRPRCPKAALGSGEASRRRPWRAPEG